MGMTIAEKIIALAAGVSEVKAGNIYSCFCSYIKGTIKATCKVIECIMTPC